MKVVVCFSPLQEESTPLQPLYRRGSLEDVKEGRRARGSPQDGYGVFGNQKMEARASKETTIRHHLLKILVSLERENRPTALKREANGHVSAIRSSIALVTTQFGDHRNPHGQLHDEVMEGYGDFLEDEKPIARIPSFGYPATAFALLLFCR